MGRCPVQRERVGRPRRNARRTRAPARRLAARQVRGGAVRGTESRSAAPTVGVLPRRHETIMGEDVVHGHAPPARRGGEPSGGTQERPPLMAPLFRQPRAADAAPQLTTQHFGLQTTVRQHTAPASVPTWPRLVAGSQAPHCPRRAVNFMESGKPALTVRPRRDAAPPCGGARVRPGGGFRRGPSPWRPPIMGPAPPQPRGVDGPTDRQRCRGDASSGGRARPVPASRRCLPQCDPKTGNGRPSATRQGCGRHRNREAPSP
jgi:hypothetical protein